MATHRFSTVLLLAMFMFTGQCAHAASVITDNPDSAKLTSNTLTINSGRPLMRAALILQALYGYVITYEDPRFVNSDDVLDIAPSLVKNYSSLTDGHRPKSIVPRSSQLSITLPASKQLSADELYQQLQALVAMQKTQSHGGHFQVLRTQDAFHIVPVEVRDRSGNWTTQGSVLDTLISLPQADRTELNLYLAIAGAVSAAAHVSMTVAVNHPLNYRPEADLQHTDISATNESARSVLLRALALHPTLRTWKLVEDPNLGPDSFLLNVLDIPTDVAAVSYE